MIVLLFSNDQTFIPVCQSLPQVLSRQFYMYLFFVWRYLSLYCVTYMIKRCFLGPKSYQEGKNKNLIPPPKKTLFFFLNSMNLLLHSFNGSFIFLTCTMKMNLSWLIQIFHIYLFQAAVIAKIWIGTDFQARPHNTKKGGGQDVLQTCLRVLETN